MNNGRFVFLLLRQPSLVPFVAVELGKSVVTHHALQTSEDRILMRSQGGHLYLSKPLKTSKLAGFRLIQPWQFYGERFESKGVAQRHIPGTGLGYSESFIVQLLN